MDENTRFVYIANMTNFFKRERYMHSIGDISFNKPIAMKKMAYTMLFLIIWTIPIVLIFGIKLNIFFAAFALLPPFVLGHYASKPIWGGRSLVDFIKTTAIFIGEPKAWTDLKENNTLNNDKYTVEEEIWISRRRELAYLADLQEKENEMNGITPSKKRSKTSNKPAIEGRQKTANKKSKQKSNGFMNKKKVNK